MRFMEGGPSLPDKLLRARDEGRVVFFCGAGVSRARAGLADFFGLAASVIQKLGALEDSDACKVLRKAREIGEELDVTGLISADRVFSLLERDFTTSDIQSAVAQSLAPASKVDRSAHEILLRLALTPAGRTQLVTTNFDRLFESELTTIPQFQPPRLPQPSRFDDLDGIVYLHGRVDSEYKRADGNGLILSSSDFGHAYLSEGWATQFFREIVREFVVVFVGYSADDPPVHYLLEGLSRNADSLQRIYAFQADESAELTARWRHKRVEAIPYSPANRHQSLWDTLDLWAIRADDPEEWQQSLFKEAMAGPRKLKPHQRGQIAHIVSTIEGARAFAEQAPPADWLCVFDPRCRYEIQRKLDWTSADYLSIDPFSLYGLDHDEIPQRSGDNTSARQSQVPNDAWDAFAISDLDQQTLSPKNYPAVRGPLSSNVPELPTRLTFIGLWIGKVVHQPAAMWWGARQESLHLTYRRSIEWGLSHLHNNINRDVQNLWGYILEAWNTPRADSRRDWYDLKQDLKQDGWSLAGVRRFIKLSEPYLKVGPGLMSYTAPPTSDEKFRISDLVRVTVECPTPPNDADMPDKWLHDIIKGLRTNLEVASRLCHEVKDYQISRISPIEVDDRPNLSRLERTRGFSGCVVSFAALFERLLTADAKRAKAEVAAWCSDEWTAFARLRLWASGKPKVATPTQFAKAILGLSADVFWGSDHQRDLLISLAARWAMVPLKYRLKIEKRILLGPLHYEVEDDSHRERLAWEVLSRLQWLFTHGCKFSFDVESEIARLKIDAPGWTPAYAERAAESREIRSGWVATDTEHTALMREPIVTILSKARELSGRSGVDHLRENDPFAGLCAESPRRAYLALAHPAENDELKLWGWNTFLDSDSRKTDRSNFSAVIATRLCRMPDDMLSLLIYAATWWLQRVSKAITTDCPEVFDRTVQRFIEVVQAAPEVASSIVAPSHRERDWVTEAINSPVGHLVRAVFDDARIEASATAEIALGPVEQCLSLPGDPRRHAIAVTSHQLQWIYANSVGWTEQHLLSILEVDDDEDRDAFWAGLFWNPHVSSPALYSKIKDGLLTVVKDPSSSREGDVESMACLLLTGWVSVAGNEDRSWVNSAEFRDVLLYAGNELRSHVLWQFARVLQSENAEEREAWRCRSCEFFKDVWPRQRSAKSPEMTARLCEVLLADAGSFATLIDVVSPFLTTIRDATGLHIHLQGEVKALIQTHPERFLHLLHIILPEDARYWPYGISEALDIIAEADNSLAQDDRFGELRRRWNAR